MARCFIRVGIRARAMNAEMAARSQSVLIMVIIDLPDAAQKVPHESPIMGLVRVAPAVLQIVPDGRIDVAAHGEALLPVILTVLLSALLEVLGDLQEHGFGRAGVVSHSERTQGLVEMGCVAGFLEKGDVIQRNIRVDFDRATKVLRYHPERHEITSPLPFLHIPYRTGRKFPALTRVLNHGAPSEWQRSPPE
jgi:hypothetical protein